MVWLIVQNDFVPMLIELSGSSSQHEDAQSVHAWWDAEIIEHVEKLQTNVVPFEY